MIFVFHYLPMPPHEVVISLHVRPNKEIFLGYRRYKLVASVDGDSINKAFSKTQHISHLNRLWWENTGVSNLSDEMQCRSTMVGDIFERGSNYYLVAPVGFRKAYLENEIFRIDIEKVIEKDPEDKEWYDILRPLSEIRVKTLTSP